MQGRHPAVTLALVCGGILIVALFSTSAPIYAQNATPSVIYACVDKNNGNTRIVAENVSCKSAERRVYWNIQGPAGPQGQQGSQGATGATGPAGPSGPGAAETVVLARSVFIQPLIYVNFPTVGDRNDSPGVWDATATGGGCIGAARSTDITGSSGQPFLMLILQANGGNVCRQIGPGTATLTSRRSASVSAGTLIFETELTSDGNVGQPDLRGVGLVAGTDRNDAIEFLTAGTGLSQNQMACRTVSGGVTTQTIVEVTPGYGHHYRIVASSNNAKFYVDGVLVANHTTNIPTSALNVFFGISATGTPYAAFIPSYATFEFVPSSP